MKKILITGISGFAGSHLAEELLTHPDVAVYGTHTSDKHLSNLDLIKEKISLIKLNLLDADNVKTVLADTAPDIIFHLAAMSAVGSSFNNPGETITTNAQVQINLHEAVNAANLSETKIIIISSAYVYGLVHPEDLPINESVPFRPNNPYGTSKITQDFLGLQYFNSHNQRIVRLRPFNHIGPRMSTDLAIGRFAREIALMEKGDKEPILTVGNLEAKRDFTDVRDMVKAYVLAADHCPAGEVYNLGSGQSHAMSVVVQTLLSFATVKITVQPDTSLLRKSDLPELVCDAGKFHKETGWKPEIPLETSLKDTLEYWRNIL